MDNRSAQWENGESEFPREKSRIAIHVAEHLLPSRLEDWSIILLLDVSCHESENLAHVGGSVQRPVPRFIGKNELLTEAILRLVGRGAKGNLLAYVRSTTPNKTSRE